MQRSFEVTALWDEEEQIWVSQSDIEGLHIEAASIGEFNALVHEFASELIVTNHYADVDFTGKDMRELIPAIVISHDGGPSKAA